MSEETRHLHEEIARLKAEIDHLKSMLIEDPSRALPRIHYLYASPLVLMDSLGSMVVDTFDPLRIEHEFRSIRDSISRSFTVSVTAVTTNNINRLTTVNDSILHIAMHTIDVPPYTQSSRCVLDDDHGRGYLMSDEEFFDLFRFAQSDSIKLVFLNACKSLHLGKLIELKAPNIAHIVCTTEQVFETSAQIFAKEFYYCISNKMTVRESFERANFCLKSYPSLPISSQSCCFKLLPENSDLHDYPITCNTVSPSRSLGGVSQTPTSLPWFWVGYLTPEVSSYHEDFVGRQVDLVRLCGLMFPAGGTAGGNSRRICLVTGQSGIGKDSFLAESMKFFASPGGRPLSGGGVCLIRLSDKKDILSVLHALITGVKETIASVHNWGSWKETPRRPRLDSVQAETGVSSLPTTHPDLKSYKVFWAETFSNSDDLLSFLDSYDLKMSPEIGFKLFNELRLNGTQLQDWGGGKLVRLVHVVRCLIRRGNEILVERRSDSTVRMLSKKFDPVTENVLEIARIACTKELGETVQVRRASLRDRKPQTEIHSSSPTYPGLATKYLLYTVEVVLEGLLEDVDNFETRETRPVEKIHHWQWLASDSHKVREIYPDLARSSDESPMHMEFEGSSKSAAFEELRDEFLKLISDWSTAAHERPSALVLLQGHEWMHNPLVRDLIGKALIGHRGLKIFYSDPTSSDGRQIGPYKVVNFPLPPLQPIDAALLFTRRIHRPLYVRDWYVDEEAPPPMFSHAASSASLILDEIADAETPLVMSTKSSKGVTNLARLARHPLLQLTRGIPAKILEIAQHVTTDLESINALVSKFNS